MEFTNIRYKINNVNIPWKLQVIAAGNPNEERSNDSDEFTDHEIQLKKNKHQTNRALAHGHGKL